MPAAQINQMEFDSRQPGHANHDAVAAPGDSNRIEAKEAGERDRSSNLKRPSVRIGAHEFQGISDNSIRNQASQIIFASTPGNRRGGETGVAVLHERLRNISLIDDKRSGGISLGLEHAALEHSESVDTQQVGVNFVTALPYGHEAGIIEHG